MEEFKVREDRRPQRRRKLSAERAAYLRLVQQGYSNAEACRVVGVHVRTGREWRNGRLPSSGHRAARALTDTAVPGASRFLTEDERIHIGGPAA
jgi:IS30 family transposase